ncbi:MAG TPA: hypothetical protein VFP34_07420 [Microlunatus sp.]|nr:hypothetical protein [Microlunatus sp.]
MEHGPWWAALTTWVVVNLVNVAQTVGFASRSGHGMAVNRLLGLVIAALSVPATIALVGFVRAGNLWWVGPAVFDAFTVLMLCVDYVWPVEWRRPARPSILIPYVSLFFGSILLMGIPMYTLNRGLWMVTVVTSAALLISMTVAIRGGAG